MKKHRCECGHQIKCGNKEDISELIEAHRKVCKGRWAECAQQ